jgi:hypothetical protein
MRLEDIDTSTLFVDPKSPNFLERMKSISPAFDFTIDKVNTKKLLTYIVLMYDKNSWLRKNEKKYTKRKFEAGEAAGFKLHEDELSNRFFHETVEDVIVGQDYKFNKAVIEYVSLMFDKEYTRIIVLDHNYNKKSEESLKSYDNKKHELLSNIIDELNTLEEYVFGGKEVVNMRKALYEKVHIDRIAWLRPEGIVDKFKKDGLEGLSPYPEGYKPDELTFAGDSIPTEE